MSHHLDYLQRIVCAGGQWNAYNVSTVTSVEIAHDADCWMLRGGRACTCCPEITVTTPKGTFAIDPHGKPQQIGGRAK